MIQVRQFLLDNKIDFGTYALVTYNNNIEPTWFTKYDFGNVEWFLESPCCLYKVADVGNDTNAFVRKYMDEVVSLEDGESEEDYINNYVLPMIVNNVMYEIENFQCAPYLSEYVDNIKLISERECLEWMLEHKNNK